VETGIPWLECLARVAVAQALADEGDRRARAAQLRAAHSLAERCASDLLRFAVDLASADAAREAADEAGALAALRAAFARGREHGYQYAPGWRSRAVAELCALALRHDIEPEYARSLVRARGLAPRVPPLRVARWPWPFRVRALGRFELLRDGAPVEVSGKGPGRPMELLKVLAALGGQEVRADQIADALWPHVDADYAHKSFTATLHRLRRLLADDEALVLRDGRLTLNSALVWVDTWALEQVCAAVDELLRLPPAPTGAAARRDPLFDLIEEALALYRGPFLPDESEQPSYIARREELRMRLLRCVTRAAKRSEDAGRHDAAADWYLRCIEADPLFEAPYRNLMLSYRRAGDAVEARATYERLRTILSARLQAAPSPETQAVFAELRASGS
jgi:DNA-binding SARP family transcriptional activator